MFKKKSLTAICIKKATVETVKQAGEILRNESGLEAWEIAVGVGVSAVAAAIYWPQIKDIITTMVSNAKTQATSIFS